MALSAVIAWELGRVPPALWPQWQNVDWAAVEQLRAFGGVRIEDDVLCTTGAPENLTRDAFAAA